MGCKSFLGSIISFIHFLCDWKSMTNIFSSKVCWSNVFTEAPPGIFLPLRKPHPGWLFMVLLTVTVGDFFNISLNLSPAVMSEKALCRSEMVDPPFQTRPPLPPPPRPRPGRKMAVISLARLASQQSHSTLSTTIFTTNFPLQFSLYPLHWVLHSQHITHCTLHNWNVPYLLLYRWNKESKCRKGERRLSGEYEFYFAQMMIRIVRLIHNLTPQFKIRQFDTTIQKIWHGNILHQKIWHHNEKSDNLTRKYFTPDNLTHLSWCQIVVVSKQ